MTIPASFPDLPKEILQKAITLRNSVRIIFIALYSAGKPCTADDIAKVVGHERASVSMRLNQLEDLGLAKSHQQGKEKIFEAIMS
jgi:DNA-binding transcriptional regulator GbsR (MarR family)